jgi:hypothetical protein
MEIKKMDITAKYNPYCIFGISSENKKILTKMIGNIDTSH